MGAGDGWMYICIGWRYGLEGKSFYNDEFLLTQIESQYYIPENLQSLVLLHYVL